MMNICISKFAIQPLKKQFVKIRKIEADSDSDGEKHTCSRLQKKFNSTCSLHINHPQLLKRNIYFCIYELWSSKVKYLRKCNMFFGKNTSLLTGGILTHKNFLALVRHRTMPGRAPYGVRTGAVRIVRYKY